MLWVYTSNHLGNSSEQEKSRPTTKKAAFTLRKATQAEKVFLCFFFCWKHVLCHVQCMALMLQKSRGRAQGDSVNDNYKFSSISGNESNLHRTPGKIAVLRILWKSPGVGRGIQRRTIFMVIFTCKQFHYSSKLSNIFLPVFQHFSFKNSWQSNQTYWQDSKIILCLHIQQKIMCCALIAFLSFFTSKLWCSASK